MGLPESLERRRCSSAGAREVFLLAKSWRHRAAGFGGVADAETRSALGRLRERGLEPHEDRRLELPASVSASVAVHLALRRALSSRPYCAPWLCKGPRL